MRFSYKQTKAYDLFANEDENDEAVFQTYRDFIIFAACLALVKGEPKEDYRGEGDLRWDSIVNTPLRKVVASSIAYAHTKKDEALVDTESQMKALAKYAVSGAEIAEREILQKGGTQLENIIEYLRRFKESESEGILKQIQEELESIQE